MAPSRIPASHPLSDLIAAFLTDLANADRSVHTQRAYATRLSWLLSIGHTNIRISIDRRMQRVFDHYRD